MNKVILIGRLVRDPEIKKTNTDISVCQFCIAVNRTFSRNSERQADFINCVAWRGLAENLARYMRKGNQIAVEGQLQVRQYEDQTGAKRNVYEVICDNINFLDSKSSRESIGFSDVNSYDIPEPRGLESFETSFDSANLALDMNKNTSDENPFKNLKTSSSISDDDLPF